MISKWILNVFNLRVPKSEIKVVQRPQIKSKDAKNLSLTGCGEDILRRDGSS